MIPSLQPVNGLLVVNETSGSHRGVEGVVIAGDHIEVGRHERAVRMDRSSSAAHQNWDRPGMSLIRSESIGERHERGEIFGRKRHYGALRRPE